MTSPGPNAPAAPGDTADILHELKYRKTPRRARERILRAIERLNAKPTSAVQHHNLAAAFGDAGIWRRAHAHIERAFSLGIDAPESWLVRARALVELADYEGAERAFVEALRRQPLMSDAQRELTQLRWMLGGDMSEAMAQLDDTIARHPQAFVLKVLKAQILDGAGFTEDARDLFAQLCAQSSDPGLYAVAAQCALVAGEFATALRLSRQSYQAAPSLPFAATMFVHACLATGDCETAARPLEQLRAANPDDQQAIALQALLCRQLGDSRYRELYDYSTFVRAYDLGTPPGWSDSKAYVADLVGELLAAHKTHTHPLHQSIKHGTQATSILDMETPAARALPIALDTPIRQHIAQLGEGADPLRSRRTGDYGIRGVWSIRMKAGGKHIDHVHPEGWLSSACHLVLPDNAPGHEGWLKFGEPGLRTATPWPAEHFVQPQAGRIVLFPSYMWHGTVPFTGSGERMTFALDLVPE